jgi:ribosomal protein S24E
MSSGERHRGFGTQDADVHCAIVISCTPASPVCNPTPSTPKLSHRVTKRNTDSRLMDLADISKNDLRAKLAELYKSEADCVSVFGLRTHFGGGKTTGFALIYDSVDSLKKFEPHYRLVRYGKATKIEKASRQQRTLHSIWSFDSTQSRLCRTDEADDCFTQQASSARTSRRLCGEPPRSRVPRRRRSKCQNNRPGLWVDDERWKISGNHLSLPSLVFFFFFGQ